MEIEIKDFEIKNEWDIQKAYLILKLDAIDGKLLSLEKKEEYERKITEFLWENVKKQFPKIEKFLTGKRGGFNKASERYYNTPIINILGDFYLQLIGHNNRMGWIWEKVNLEPYGFIFNEEGYFRKQVVDAVNKLIISGYNKKEDFKKLIDALNKTTVKEKVIGIIIKGKDAGKVFMIESESKLN